MSGITVVFKTFRDEEAGVGAAVHLKGRPQLGLGAAEAAGVATRIRRRTVHLQRSSVRIGTSVLLRHSPECLTGARSLSHHKNKDSSGESIPTTDRCSGSKMSPVRLMVDAAKLFSAAPWTASVRISV